MGVTNLWTILAPVKKHTTLTDLKGQILAVDLSIWVCENQSVKQMHGVVVKPHLRNLFFRVSHLTQLGAKLVFVVEGEAPELKWEEMWKRQQARGLTKPGATFKGGKRKRSQFASCLKECCELLDLLGIPHITGRGEAEAMCAALNNAGLVDGCITDDGDAFLYGAQTVYRNFTMNSKDPHVESYAMTDIETHLNLNRQSLVALSLLLGCDYLPGGVAGVGTANAVKLLKSLSGFDLIHRFQEWRDMSVSQCLDKVERSIREKALKQSDFPQQQVVEEFLIVKERLPRKSFQWNKANLSAAQEFGKRKLDWPIEYTLEKVLPLVTLWSMLDRKQHGPSSKHLQPHRIVKSRVRHGILCYEVEWIKDVWDTSSTCDYYVTIEQQMLYTDCYPQLVSDYNNMMENKTKSKKKVGKTRTKKEVNVDDLIEKMELVNLDKVTVTAPQSSESMDMIPTSSTNHSKLNSTVCDSDRRPQTKPNSDINIAFHQFSTKTCQSGSSDTVNNTIVGDVSIPLSVRVRQRLAQRDINSIDITVPESSAKSHGAWHKSDGGSWDNGAFSQEVNVNKPLDSSDSPIEIVDLDLCKISRTVSLSCVKDINDPSKCGKLTKVITDNLTEYRASDHLSRDNMINRTSSESSLPAATKNKKGHQKKRNKSVKRCILLLDDSGLSEPEVRISEPSRKHGVLLLNTEPALETVNSMNVMSYHNGTSAVQGEVKIGSCPKNDTMVDDLISNMLVSSFGDVSLVEDFRDDIFPNVISPCPESCNRQKNLNLATKLIYSAVKNGHRNMSTPCSRNNILISPRQINPPNSIGTNRTCNLSFGNFNIQTSLLKSILNVSNFESPVSHVSRHETNEKISFGADKREFQYHNSIDVTDVSTLKSGINNGSEVQNIDQLSCITQNLSQSPSVMERNSNSVCLDNSVMDTPADYSSKNHLLSFSPMSPIIPVITNLGPDKVIGFNESDQDEIDSSYNRPHLCNIKLADIKHSDTTYYSPVPLSLKDRLKLRFKDNDMTLLRDLSTL